MGSLILMFKYTPLVRTSAVLAVDPAETEVARALPQVHGSRYGAPGTLAQSSSGPTGRPVTANLPLESAAADPVTMFGTWFDADTPPGRADGRADGEGVR
jgi:hypothetical protein